MSCFWGHKFDAWKTVMEGDLLSPRDSGVVGHSVIQMRKCLRCGYQQLNTQRAMA